jgi:hypothetical protein
MSASPCPREVARFTNQTHGRDGLVNRAGTALLTCRIGVSPGIEAGGSRPGTLCEAWLDPKTYARCARCRGRCLGEPAGCLGDWGTTGDWELGDRCENFPYVFKGTPSARQAGPAGPGVACRDAEVSRGNRELERRRTAKAGGERGTRLLRGGSLPRATGGSPPGAALPPVGCPRTRRQPVPAPTRPR